MDDTPEFFRVFIPYASSHQMDARKIFNKDGCKKEVIVDNTTLQESKGGKACERSVHVVQQKHLGVCFKKNEKACCLFEVTSQRKLENPEETKMPKDSYFVAPRNPYFVLEISNNSKYFVYLPRLVFHPLSIKLMPNMVIHNQNGNMWLVKANFQNNGKIYFGCGWCAFIKENYAFEFVLGGENIYNEVHVQIIYGNARLEKPSQHRIRKNY